MSQLQLFTTTQLAGMRDRTASRNYSPVRDEFRREHERHRAWGLKRRHAEKLRRLHGNSGGSRAPAPPPSYPARASGPARASVRAAATSAAEASPAPISTSAPAAASLAI